MRVQAWFAAFTTATAVSLATVTGAAGTGYEKATDPGPQIATTPGSITCGPTSFGVLAPHSCTQSLAIAGTSFFNRIETKAITAVDLYWLDEPFVGFVAGSRTFATEPKAAQACIDYGVLLNTDGPVVVTDESFNYDVAGPSMPPHAKMTTNHTLRIGADPSSTATNDGQFWYGTNGICAVWDHESGGITHKSSAGIATLVIKPA